MSPSDSGALRMRPAEPGDVDLLYAWANDPDVRAQSFSGETIKYGEHTAWFAGKLASDDTRILIAMDGERPVGVVRFDRMGSECIVSITVSKEHRGKGRAAGMLRQALTTIQSEHFCPLALAYVKHENPASLKAFRAAGFVECANTALDKYPGSTKLAHALRWSE